jgi:hypothetical protein
VARHRDALSRIPVAYFLTCIELTRVPQEPGRAASTYLDPLLGSPPRVDGKLSLWERAHLLSSFMGSVAGKAAQVKPVSVAVFRGRLDYSELGFVLRSALKLIWRLSKRVPEGTSATGTPSVH